jgi:hypothetical protein
MMFLLLFIFLPIESLVLRYKEFEVNSEQKKLSNFEVDYDFLNIKGKRLLIDNSNNVECFDIQTGFTDSGDSWVIFFKKVSYKNFELELEKCLLKDLDGYLRIKSVSINQKTKSVQISHLKLRPWDNFLGWSYYSRKIWNEGDIFYLKDNRFKFLNISIPFLNLAVSTKPISGFLLIEFVKNFQSKHRLNIPYYFLKGQHDYLVTFGVGRKDLFVSVKARDFQKNVQAEVAYGSEQGHIFLKNNIFKRGESENVDFDLKFFRSFYYSLFTTLEQKQRNYSYFYVEKDGAQLQLFNYYDSFDWKNETLKNNWNISFRLDKLIKLRSGALKAWGEGALMCSQINNFNSNLNTNFSNDKLAQGEILYMNSLLRPKFHFNYALGFRQVNYGTYGKFKLDLDFFKFATLRTTHVLFVEADYDHLLNKAQKVELLTSDFLSLKRHVKFGIRSNLHKAVALEFGGVIIDKVNKSGFVKFCVVGEAFDGNFEIWTSDKEILKGACTVKWENFGLLAELDNLKSTLTIGTSFKHSTFALDATLNCLDLSHLKDFLHTNHPSTYLKVTLKCFLKSWQVSFSYYRWCFSKKDPWGCGVSITPAVPDQFISAAKKLSRVDLQKLKDMKELF